MDAVAFPQPPAPFLDDDFDFGDFTFAAAPAPAPQPQPPLATFAAFDDDWGDFVASPLGSNVEGSAPPTPQTATSASSWEKPRGPLPLSLFGADDEQEEEGPVEPPPPPVTAHKRSASFTSDGSRPADLKDLIAGLYGSQPAPAAGAVDAGAQGEAEDGEGFGDDDWEFTAATAESADRDGGGRAPRDGTGKIEVSVAHPGQADGGEGFGDDDWEFTAAAAEPADQDGGGRAPGDGIGKIEDISKSLSTDQEGWPLFTSLDESLNHVHQTTANIGTHESTGELAKASSWSPANNSAILNLYIESARSDAIHIEQSSVKSVQCSSDLFSNNEMMKTIPVDQQVIAF